MPAPAAPGPIPPLTPSRRARRSRWAVAPAVLVVVLAGACSSDPEGPSPEDAARVVASGFSLGPEVRTCLEDRFDDDRDATVALGIGGRASAAQRDDLGAVLTSCISPEVLSGAVAASIAAGVPGTSEDQTTCLREAVLDLDEDRRDLLMVGLALSGDGVPDQLDVELGEVTGELFEVCDVSLAPSAPGPDAPPGAAGESDAPAVSDP
jgi:hypothetical protein